MNIPLELRSQSFSAWIDEASRRMHACMEANILDAVCPVHGVKHLQPQPLMEKPMCRQFSDMPDPKPLDEKQQIEAMHELALTLDFVRKVGGYRRARMLLDAALDTIAAHQKEEAK